MKSSVSLQYKLSSKQLAGVLGLEICGVAHPIKRNGRTMMTILMMIKIMMTMMVLKGKHFLSYQERRKLHKEKPLWNV